MTDVRLSFPGDRKAYTFYGSDDHDEQPLVHLQDAAIEQRERSESSCGRRAGIIVGGHIVGQEFVTGDPDEATCEACKAGLKFLRCKHCDRPLEPCGFRLWFHTDGAALDHVPEPQR